ncbi:GTPase-activating protein [Tilletia horrida]|uniref:GTPase-activating protein GYP5 n=1 Tax=Tilletia horrida TaxID=155126 RepID=A0AAN6GGE1_9BASI|nr:GTPase-activating protein [Tilletia horrida]
MSSAANKNKPSGGVAALAKRWEAAGGSTSSSSAGGSGSTTPSPPSGAVKKPAAIKTAAVNAAAAAASSTGVDVPPSPSALDGTLTPKMRNASSQSDADSSAGAWATVEGAEGPGGAGALPATPAMDPSVGAKSLIEPGTTIANPFSTDAAPADEETVAPLQTLGDELTNASVDTQLSSPPADSPRRYSLASDLKTELEQAAGTVAPGASGAATADGSSSGSVPPAPASVGTASSQASRRQSFQSATDMRRGPSTNSESASIEANSESGASVDEHAAGHPSAVSKDDVRDSTHFSVVSLGGDGPLLASASVGPEAEEGASSTESNSRPEELRFQPKDAGQTPDASANSSDPDTALIRARVEAQSAQLERDPKAWRASIDGAAKIRESFERKMHARQGSISSPGSDVTYKRSTLRNVSAGPSSEPVANLSDTGAKDEEGDADASTPTLMQQENGHRPDSSSFDAASSEAPAIPAKTRDSTLPEPPHPLPDEPEAVEAALPEIRDANGDADEEGEEAVDWTFWGEIMSNYAEVARTRPQELSQAIRRGIPAALRGMMWQLMSSSKDEELEIIYQYYLKQTSPHEKAIRRDLSRTFPEQEYFADGKGVGQENLFNVIKAYSLYDEECGYCQGMQFVVGPLLLNMPDEEAFSTLARLMKSYDLRGHYIPNMPSLQLRLYQFDRLLEEFLPLLHKHLVRQGVKSSMYAAQWFMTLLYVSESSYRFPLELVYRILDSVFAEGIETLFRFSIALMQRNEDRLLSLNFERAVQFLKDNLFDAYLREDPEEDAPRTPKMSSSGPAVGSATASKYHTAAFVTDAYQVRITPHQLDAYAAEFEEHVRKANAHRREVDALRLVNRNLSAKIKELEVQLTQVNNEHVDLVKQVVMAKLEKDEIAEELARYKLMYAEAVLQADQGNGPGGRGSLAGLGGIGSAGGSSTRTSRSAGV